MADKANPKVDAFIERQQQWRAEFEMLRAIALDCPVTEEVKWGKPCYTFDGANIGILQGFKKYCALMFPKGVLLKDPDGLLVQIGPNTQSARQLRYTDVAEIDGQRDVVKAYLLEAIEVEKAGLEVEFKKTEDFDVPEEFQTKLDELPELAEAFHDLTPGRQRAYLRHFAGAKQSTTRSSRVEKAIPDILDGKGLNDR